MLLLLPPSETKSRGGQGSLSSASLGFPELADGRSGALAALQALVSAGQDTSTPAKAAAAEANARVLDSGVMPAIDRYTGVLFDALDAGSLDATARAWVDRHVAIGSALFGLVRATDEIPDYKLSHNTKLPGTTMRRIWSAVSPLHLDGLVIDMRSKAYAALLPVTGAIPLEVVDEEGVALSHWNKRGKGEFARLLAEGGAEASTPDELVKASRRLGIHLRLIDDSLVLTIEHPVAKVLR